MFFADKLTLDKPRRSADGYMAIHARSARSGIYKYLGREIDPAGEHFAADQVVNVYRPAEEVFDKQSLGSFVGKPITDDHPDKAVTADNWRDLARGTIMGAAKDGEYVGFDLAFLDAATIKAVDAGKRELSNGYQCDLVIEDGEVDGVAYQAVQRKIRGNHVAVVDKGRAGATCRIGDAAACTVILSDEVIGQLADERTYNAEPNDNINDPARRETSNSGGSPVATKTITFDGLPLEVTDAAEAAITKLLGTITTLTADKGKVETDLADAKTTLAERDAEIVNLKQAVEDAKVTPAQLRDQAKAYALVCDKAKALEVKFAEDADIGTIMKAVVDAKMGDTAKDYDAKQIAAAFDVLTKDAKVEERDPVRDALSNGVKTSVQDRNSVETARRAWLADKSSAYRKPATQGVN